MRALLITPGTASGLSLGDTLDPVPAANEVLVDVEHVSLNYGEIGFARAPEAERGAVHGWDAAGVVARAAADGSGPAVGSRVVTFGGGGAWAQLRAVPVGELAVVPDDVSLAVASAVPVAGVTALRALRRSGPLLGRRVLVTGASGGVGRFAVQLAARGGAHVVAVSGRGAGLAELGAHEVVSSLDDVGPLDVVIDNVGGPQLVRAWELLEPGGVVQSIGWTSGEPAVFQPYSTVGPAKSLTAFQMGSDLSADLEYLTSLIAAGALTVDIGWRGSWLRYDEAAEALLGREVTGKAVLDVE
ncbi:NADPH:quinone reductase-like Zn-dependent oxidoreductase [Saccharopolyspora erythraea NRRL 2338]|nr:zinc-binding dehydrogenase [Saccharopolyspora erythraea]PFG92933.1 NADPH:quinone reductase-like Zn-dependent oxidoreductase [Saccharopolyspora erythraea NRRL 2338]QRK89831.1 zinc-binding dehydrogenase [Saccharopolyspora erythraea]